jgi:hypothetical protein
VPGKTTWARYAFAAAGGKRPPSPDAHFYHSLQDTHRQQAMYRMLYDDIEQWELEDVERSIAGRLLHEHLKYRVHPAGEVNWSNVAT